MPAKQAGTDTGSLRHDDALFWQRSAISIPAMSKHDMPQGEAGKHATCTSDRLCSRQTLKLKAQMMSAGLLAHSVELQPTLFSCIALAALIA
jgi:hypothetical protein